MCFPALELNFIAHWSFYPGINVGASNQCYIQSRTILPPFYLGSSLNIFVFWLCFIPLSFVGFFLFFLSSCFSFFSSPSCSLSLFLSSFLPFKERESWRKRGRGRWKEGILSRFYVQHGAQLGSQSQEPKFTT